MSSDRQEILIWIGTTVVVLLATALYLWLTSPEVDLLPETYNVM